MTEKSQAVATVQPPRSVIADMANRFGMEPAPFEATIRATCMPSGFNQPVATKEEFAAFLLVAREYSLNPLTKEIYAFARKGGGIVPVVSIDGWVKLINERKELDGIEFDVEHEDKKLVSITCRIWRKDRKLPTIVTEYLSECKRPTEPWKMEHRMLRHKALIQCARYAFGFSGIYDEDEADRIAQAHAAESQPPAPPPPPKRSTKPHEEPKQQEAQPAAEPVIEEAQIVEPESEIASLEEMLQFLDDKLANAKSEEELDEFYDDFGGDAEFTTYEQGVEQARGLRELHRDRIQREESKAPKEEVRPKAEPETATVADVGFPGDEELERIQAESQAVENSLRDPLAPRTSFKGGGAYIAWINDALAAAKPGDGKRLSQDVWNSTTPIRQRLVQEGQLAKADVDRMRDLVGAKLEELKPRKRAKADEGVEAPEEPATVTAYDAELKAAMEAATTVADVVNFWEDTKKRREEEVGAGTGKKITWSSLMQRRRAELKAQG